MECHYDLHHFYFVIMVSVVMLSIIMFCIIMLSVIIFSVVMLCLMLSFTLSIMQDVITLSIKLSVIILSDVILNGVILSVVASTILPFPSRRMTGSLCIFTVYVNGLLKRRNDTAVIVVIVYGVTIHNNDTKRVNTRFKRRRINDT